MTLASKLSGSFSLSDLNRLKFPVAWSGAVPESEQVTEETELHELVDDAISQLQDAYSNGLWDLEEGQELEVKIVDGEITEIVIG